MKKNELNTKVKLLKSDTKQAILTILDNLNQGQRKKVLKNEEVKKLCERYGITE